MASVFIDIPGVGTVEAKGAASEATLRDLVAAVNKSSGNKGKSSPSSGSGGSGSGGGGSGGPPPQVGAGFKNLGLKIGMVAGGFTTLSNRITDTVSDFSNLSNGAESAAKIFSKLPIIGGALGGIMSTVAGAAEKTNDAFVAASASGASFGGSLASFSASASAAGMNMQEFGNLISKNGAAMLAFGSEGDSGAKNFARVSKNLRATSSDLYALGMSTSEINSGLANYGALLRSQGLQGTKSNKELAAGAKSYLKEMDLLAKVTGKSREAMQAEQDKLAKDAQFQAAMAGASEAVRKSFMSTVTALPEGVQAFAKDMLANGTATTEENQKILAQMPESAAMLAEMQQKMQRGEAVTQEERNALNNKMKEEGARNLKNIKSAGAASAELAGTVNALASTQQINTDGLKNSSESQKKAAAETDAMNKKMQEFQQFLNQLSNTFSTALASSGVLDVLMSAFGIIANLVTSFVLPAFMILSDALTVMGLFVAENLKPAFASVGDFISNTLYPAFLTLASVVLVDIVPVLQGMATMVSEYVVPVLTSIGQTIGEYLMPVMKSLASFISDNLVPILVGLGTGLVGYGAYLAVNTALGLVQNAMLAIANVGLIGLAGAALAAAAPILAVVAPIVLLIAAFKYLYDTGWSFGTALDAIGDNLKRFFLLLQDGFLSVLDKITFGDANAEIKLKQKEVAAQRKILDENEKVRDLTRKGVAEERKSETKKKARDQKEEEIDKKLIGLKDRHNKKLGIQNDKAEAEQARTNFGSNNTLDILKSEVAIAGGKKSGGVSAAETGKKEIEAKKEAEAKAKAESEEKKKTEGSAAPAPTQESAESLLASLNTKLDQLIKVNKDAYDVGEQQLRVQRSLTNDLFVS